MSMSVTAVKHRSASAPPKWRPVASLPSESSRTPGEPSSALLLLPEVRTSVNLGSATGQGVEKIQVPVGPTPQVVFRIPAQALVLSAPVALPVPLVYPAEVGQGSLELQPPAAPAPPRPWLPSVEGRPSRAAQGRRGPAHRARRRTRTSPARMAWFQTGHASGRQNHVTGAFFNSRRYTMPAPTGGSANHVTSSGERSITRATSTQAGPLDHRGASRTRRQTRGPDRPRAGWAVHNSQRWSAAGAPLCRSACDRFSQRG